MKLKLTKDIYLEDGNIGIASDTVFTVIWIKDNLLVGSFFDGAIKTFVALDECDTI